MKRFIYLDNAATTKTRPEVVDAMLPYFTEFYGNPSSVYEFSNESKKAINRSSAGCFCYNGNILWNAEEKQWSKEENKTKALRP